MPHAPLAGSTAPATLVRRPILRCWQYSVGLSPVARWKRRRNVRGVEPGVRGHCRQRHVAGAVRLKPVLDAEHPRVAVVQARVEAAVVPLLPPGRVEQHEARRRDRNGGAEQAVDDGEAEVRPGHHRAGGDDVAIIDDDAGGVDANGRAAGGEVRRLAPMQGGGAAVEQTRARKQVGTGANRAEDAACAVAVLRPAPESIEHHRVARQNPEARSRDRHPRPARQLRVGVEGLEHCPTAASGRQWVTRSIGAVAPPSSRDCSLAMPKTSVSPCSAETCAPG